MLVFMLSLGLTSVVYGLLTIFALILCIVRKDDEMMPSNGRVQAACIYIGFGACAILKAFGVV